MIILICAAFLLILVYAIVSTQAGRPGAGKIPPTGNVDVFLPPDASDGGGHHHHSDSCGHHSDTDTGSHDCGHADCSGSHH